MSGLERVLVGLDLNETTAAYILARACQVADADHIEVVHVCDHLHQQYMEYGHTGAAFANSEELDAATRREADIHLARVCEPLQIKRRRVLGGHTANVIREQAKENADLVVVGSHGRHGWRLLFGSTSNAVLHGTPCHVLAVHLPEGQPPKGPQGQYRQFLVAVDLSTEHDRLMDQAASLSAQCGAAIALCHVFTHRATQESQEQAQHKLETLGVAYGLDKDAVYLRQGHIADEIHLLAKELEADLILVATHGKHGLALVTGSTANAVLHGAECDVFSVLAPKD